MYRRVNFFPGLDNAGMGHIYYGSSGLPKFFYFTNLNIRVS